MDLALNYLQMLICHKTQQTKPNQLQASNGFRHTEELWYNETVCVDDCAYIWIDR